MTRDETSILYYRISLLTLGRYLSDYYHGRFTGRQGTVAGALNSGCVNAFKRQLAAEEEAQAAPDSKRGKQGQGQGGE